MTAVMAVVAVMAVMVLEEGLLLPQRKRGMIMAGCFCLGGALSCRVGVAGGEGGSDDEPGDMSGICVWMEIVAAGPNYRIDRRASGFRVGVCAELPTIDDGLVQDSSGNEK